MKQIFDWLRWQLINERDSLPTLSEADECFDNGINCAIDFINEAEAKWEKECCEWKFFKPSSSLYEKHGDFRTGDELEKWSVCPYCGKPIKISEVE